MKTNFGLIATLILATLFVVHGEDRFLFLHSGSVATTPLTLKAGEELLVLVLESRGFLAPPFVLAPG